MLGLWLALPALAQSVTLDAGVVLEGAPGTFYERGTGAPSVVWDPSQQRFIMVFETQLGDPDASCAEGTWALGVASSLDGTTWEVWPDPLVSPTAGTPYSCYAAHPAVVRDESGTFHVWFKAGQRSDACAVSTPSWGCAVQPGIGKVTAEIELDDKADEIALLEADLLDLEAEIDGVLADLGLAVGDFLDALEASDALQCVNYADICSPCDSLTLSVTFLKKGPAVTDSQALCQAFQFNTPMSIPTTSGSAGKAGFAFINFGVVSGTSSCKYKGSSNNLLSPFDRDIAIGQCAAPANPTYVELEVTSASNLAASTTATVTLVPTNVQAWQGPGYSAMITFEAAANALDLASVDATASTALAVLDGLEAQLAALAPTAETGALDLEAQLLEAEILGALATIDAIQADIAATEAAIVDLEAYQQGVTVTPIAGLSRVRTRAAFPTVAKVGSTWHMQYQVARNVFGATSSDGVTFTEQATATINYATIPWATSEVFSPSLVCGDDAAGPDRFQTYLGGRSTNLGVPGATVLSGSFGLTQSSSFGAWVANAMTLASWVGNNDWRHAEALKSGSDLRVWVSEKDAGTGQPVIRHGASGNPATTGGSGRTCE